MNMTAEGFDVIGDVHGCGRMLAALLGELGYEESDESSSSVI
jgi:hypothetical protein